MGSVPWCLGAVITALGSLWRGQVVTQRMGHIPSVLGWLTPRGQPLGSFFLNRSGEYRSLSVW